MLRQTRVSASLTQARRNGDWGARSADGRHFVVPRHLISGEGTLAPRSGVKVVLTLTYSGDTATVVEIRRDEQQFEQAGSARDMTRTLKQSRFRQTRILVVGRTGVGKSSTINSLIGSHVASVGHFEPTTSELHFFNGQIAGVPILVVDTPGFADSRSDRSNDEIYVDLITRLTGEIDLLLFITGLNDARVEKGEHDTMDILARQLSPEIWDRSIVLLTRSDKVSRREFPSVLAGRTRVLRQAFYDAIGERSSTIPFVPISNERTRTPNRKQWMGELWVQMLNRISEHGFESFALTSIARLSIDGNDGDLDETAPSRRGDDSRVDDRSWERDMGRTAVDAEVRPRPANQPVGGHPIGNSTGIAVSTRPTSVPVSEEARGLTLVDLAPIAELQFPTRATASPSPSPPNPSLYETGLHWLGDDSVVRNRFEDSGVTVVRTDFEVDNASHVTVNAQQAQVIGQIVHTRSPGLLASLAAAGSWIWKRVKNMFGFG